ncbi:MAG: TauD/TfdA family dioxygenase [Gammaproteobacteria bacterium]|nr:TauD/TfdA family dioxygenase [Gammaproteobacteria bacterium]
MASTATELVDQPIRGPQAWSAYEMRSHPERWTYRLTAAERDEILMAVEGVRARGTDILDLRVEDFPLPVFGVRLQKLRREMLHERGFSFIKGMPIEGLDRRGAAIAFWGIGTHLGLAVSQNGKGHVLGHVTNLGLNYEDLNTRGYQTAARLPFHTDYADLVGLLCLHGAAEGGKSSIVSSVSIYNRMLQERPDLVSVLRQPLYRTRWGEVDSTLPHWVEVPAFSVHEQGVMTSYVRSAVRKAQVDERVPRLTDQQVEAMDYFDALAESPDMHLDMDFEVGDLQFLNNHWILHSRTAYVDPEPPAPRRHLLRLWLACEDGPPFPLASSESFQGLTMNGRPNGIHVSGVPFNAPLEAE